MSLWSAVGDLFSAGASLYGAKMGADANTEAAAIANQGLEKQADAIREGNALAQERWDEVMAGAKPGQTYLRSVVLSDPYNLSPAQKRAVDDTRRTVSRTLRGTGVSGSGRSMTAAIRDAEGRTKDAFVEGNKGRQQQGANSLYSGYGTAAAGSAGANLSTGQRVGQTYADAGANTGNAGTANAGLWGSAIGDVAGIINNAANSNERESRYAGYLDKLTNSNTRSLGEN